MDWILWIASKHILVVHVPIAAAILVPLPILAAQRGGRGIRPWWTTCRYLTGAGLLGALLALGTGYAKARSGGILAPGAWFAPADPGIGYLFRLHEAGGVLALVLGAVCLRALYRKRQEHQGIGVPALLLGLLWCAVALVSAWTGSVLAGKRPPHRFLLAPPVLKAEPKPEPPAPAPAPAPRPAEPEAQAPLRVLDYLSLKAQHPEPVKSPAHGNRWIRVWVDAAGEKAYQEGTPLPPGAIVVLTTQEDRWGRPGPDAGPFYALEGAADGRTRFTFYWPQVPEARRAELQGEARAYWRDGDPRLQACNACHAQGLAPRKDRSRFGVPRKPRPEGAAVQAPAVR
ncbi:hypothetical protein [Mesoterricola sediminis]|uniref:Uncharacterized protein n=1 Tax=Mesoterricola sediminis TaxID=2927980 RepID=A0AA48H0B1_9BACT|nr:hypothetical protein [Mesoterricola sediminis]BDU75136.1 hypothetical protein METESE_00940 [Mesoterricola sediminis]